MECDKWSLIVVEDELMECVMRGFGEMHRKKVFYVNRWYVVASKDEAALSYPQFGKLSKLSSGGKS